MWVTMESGDVALQAAAHAKTTTDGRLPQPAGCRPVPKGNFRALRRAINKGVVPGPISALRFQPFATGGHGDFTVSGDISRCTSLKQFVTALRDCRRAVRQAVKNRGLTLSNHRYRRRAVQNQCWVLASN